MPMDGEREARIFAVESRFEQMAKRPGGIPRRQALARAQAHVDEMKPDFTNWLDLKLQELRDALAQINGTADRMPALEQAASACAQLGDVGTTMGFELVTFVAGSLCTILEAIKDGAAYDKGMVDCHIDALLLARTKPYRNLRPDQVPEMSNGLLRVVALASGAKPHNKQEPVSPIAADTPLVPEHPPPTLD
jgi:hypothetical protein